MLSSAVKRAFLSLLFLGTFAFFLQPAHGANVTARIKGTVTDPVGAVVPKAQVTATNVLTGVKFTTLTNASGDYLFPQLPIGTYSIAISAPGFNSFTATGIVLNIDQEYVESPKLTIGTNVANVEVQADSVQVNTTDIQLSNIVTSQEMVELPLIGRGFTALETILPGVQASSDRFGSYSADGAQTQQSEYLINGADTNDIALNTVVFSPNLDAIDEFNLITGPLNAEYDRNSGGIVSATIKQGTNHFHGDGFEFYRDTFLNTSNYFQSQFTPTGAFTGVKTNTAYHQNQFGGTVGGPIIKDKLFGFFAYQGTRQRVPGTNGGGNTSVFSNAQRTGDFSAELDNTSNPVSSSYEVGKSSPSAGDPIPGTITQLTSLNPACAPTTTANGNTWGACLEALGGKVPATAFNPIATKLLNSYVPTANSGNNTYIFQSITRTTTDQYIGRADYAINTKNQVTALYLQQKSTAASNIPFTGASVPGFGENDTSAIHQVTGDYVHQFSATLVNDFAAHWTRFNYGAVTPQNIVSPGSLGFSISPQDAAAASVPTISTGYFTLGFSTNGPQPRIDMAYQLDDSVAKTLGHHQLKFGYDGRKFSENNPFYATNSGSYGFGGGLYSTGDPGLDFLLGIPASYSQGTGGINQAHAFLNYVYAQDNWKATDTLTLSFGLGYSIDTPLINDQFGGEGLSCFIPNQQSKVYPSAPVGINYPGDSGCTRSAQAYTRHNEFGPRVGFAWAPDLGFISAGNSKKFSIYGGYGIYYDRTEEESSLNNLQTPPFGLSSQGAVDYGASAPAFANPFQDLNTGTVYTNKFPYKTPAKGAAVDYSIYEPLDLNTYDKGFRSPYSMNYQLSVEREFPARIVTRLSYIGSLGRHNQSVYEGNPTSAAGHAACLAATTTCGAPYGPATGSTGVYYRFYQSVIYPTHSTYGEVDPNTGIPAYPSIGVVTSGGVSNYNSFQADITKAVTHGLQLQLSYTLAHSLDNASNYENAGYGGARGFNQFQPSLNYGNSQFDARQRLVFAPIYISPIRKGSEWYSPLSLATSGWEISAITTLATGFPFDIAYDGGTASSNSAWCSPSYSFYACPDEPNQVGPITRTANIRTRPGLASGSTYTTFFNQTGLAPAPIGQFGNESRYKYHGPGINNTNLVLAKNINVSNDGVRRLQLRMESDNVFNHTQFSNPSASVGISSATGATSYGSFGRISGAAAARLTQLAAKFYF
jgi:hypothetical protein